MGKISSEDIMRKCSVMREKGMIWRNIADELGVKSHSSLSATYSIWMREKEVEHAKSEPKMPGRLTQAQMKQLSKIMAEAFQSVNVNATFKMDTPKFFVETFKSMVEEIKLTRMAFERFVEISQTMENLDRDVRILLENNMPLNRRGK